MRELTFIMGVCLVAMLGSGAAFADECLADKFGQNNLVGAPTAPVGVADNELASVDRPKENVKLLERRLRLRLRLRLRNMVIAHRTGWHCSRAQPC